MLLMILAYLEVMGRHPVNFGGATNGLTGLVLMGLHLFAFGLEVDHHLKGIVIERKQT